MTKRFASRNIVDVTAPVSAVQQAFNTTINTYRQGNSTFYANATEPSLPASVSAAVQSISGLNSLSVAQPNSHIIGGSTSSHSAQTVTSGIVQQNGDPAKLQALLKRIAGERQSAAKSVTAGRTPRPTITAHPTTTRRSPTM